MSTPRSTRGRSHPAERRLHVVLQEVLGDAHQAFGREADVADVLDGQQGHHELLEALHGDVRHITAGDHDVADLRGASQVVEHQLPTFVLLDLELVLEDLQGVVAHQVHARAVAAVLRARGDQLGQDLRRIAMGEALDRPHVGLVQRVARRHRVARPLRLAVAEGGRHVAADPIVAQIRDLHRVDHLRRDEHGHRGPLFLVAADVLQEVVAEVLAEGLLELLEVLHGVGALPLRRLPLLLGHVRVPGEAGPVRFLVRTFEGVAERLVFGRVSMGLAVARSCGRRLRSRVHAHVCTPWFTESRPGRGWANLTEYRRSKASIPEEHPAEPVVDRRMFGAVSAARGHDRRRSGCRGGAGARCGSLGPP